MDIIQMIETLGIPVAVALALGYCCIYLIKFINQRLTERIDELRNILIKLIDQQKLMQLDIKKMEGGVDDIHNNIPKWIQTIIKLIKTGKQRRGPHR